MNTSCRWANQRYLCGAVCSDGKTQGNALDCRSPQNVGPTLCLGHKNVCAPSDTEDRAICFQPFEVVVDGSDVKVAPSEYVLVGSGQVLSVQDF